MRQSSVSFGNSTAIRSLNLSCCSLDSISLHKISNAIVQCVSLQSLNVGLNDLGDYAILDLLSTLCMSTMISPGRSTRSVQNSGPSIRYLCLASNRLTDASAEAVCTFLATMTSVETIDLQDNHYSDRLASGLARDLAHSSRLSVRHIDLTRNSISSNGVLLLGKAICPSSVYTLSLAANLAQDEALRVFQQALMRNQERLGYVHVRTPGDGASTPALVSSPCGSPKSSRHSTANLDSSAVKIPRPPLMALSNSDISIVRSAAHSLQPLVHGQSVLETLEVHSEHAALQDAESVTDAVLLQSPLHVSSSRLGASGALSSSAASSSRSPSLTDMEGVDVAAELRVREEQIVRVVERRAERYVSEYAELAEQLRARLEAAEKKLHELSIHHQKELVEEIEKERRRHVEQSREERQLATMHLDALRQSFEQTREFIDASARAALPENEKDQLIRRLKNSIRVMQKMHKEDLARAEARISKLRTSRSPAKSVHEAELVTFWKEVTQSVVDSRCAVQIPTEPLSPSRILQASLDLVRQLASKLHQKSELLKEYKSSFDELLERSASKQRAQESKVDESMDDQGTELVEKLDQSDVNTVEDREPVVAPDEETIPSPVASGETLPVPDS